MYMKQILFAGFTAILLTACAGADTSADKPRSYDPEVIDCKCNVTDYKQHQSDGVFINVMLDARASIEELTNYTNCFKDSLAGGPYKNIAINYFISSHKNAAMPWAVGNVSPSFNVEVKGISKQQYAQLMDTLKSREKQHGAIKGAWMGNGPATLGMIIYYKEGKQGYFEEILPDMTVYSHKIASEKSNADNTVEIITLQEDNKSESSYTLTPDGELRLNLDKGRYVTLEKIR